MLWPLSLNTRFSRTAGHTIRVVGQSLEEQPIVGRRGNNTRQVNGKWTAFVERFLTSGHSKHFKMLPRIHPFMHSFKDASTH